MHPVQFHTVGEQLQPILQVQPGQGPGDQVGQQNGFEELPAQHVHDFANTGTEYLAQANFPGAQPCHQCGHGKQAKTGDGNGQQGNTRDQP